MKPRTSFSILLVFLLCHGLGLAQQIPSLVAQHGYADMILVNGKIVTMDERRYVPDVPGRIYEAMAVKGKKIMVLGTDEEMRRLAGSQTRIVDLGKKTVIPRHHRNACAQLWDRPERLRPPTGSSRGPICAMK